MYNYTYIYIILNVINKIHFVKTLKLYFHINKSLKNLS